MDRITLGALAATLAVMTVSAAGVMPAAGATNPVPPPQNGVYLGAFVNPEGLHRAPASAFKTLMNDFESQLAAASGHPRVMALHLHFYSWNNVGEIGTDPSIADDFAKGRVPIIGWTCGDSLRSISAGGDDTTLVQAARAFASLKKPVMMRWFHEFNFNLQGGHVNGQAENCFDYDPSRRPDENAATQGQEFIAAWRHVHDVFVREGATNVAWVWNPGGGTILRRANVMQFFPGSQYVDWLGVDFYDRKGTGFAANAQPFYDLAHASQPQLPIVVVENGEQAASGLQPQYFSDMAASLPTRFPQIKAVVYFDNPGNKPNNWSLTPEGLQAFARMAAQPFFAPMPPT
ncbi:MAG TPA: glycosyl hydrolase [Candidatus Baltobacteraceae bacterium]|nr:glycosyl hydrolase [Candidatus Baltobacteraceae bacterium]